MKQEIKSYWIIYRDLKGEKHVEHYYGRRSNLKQKIKRMKDKGIIEIDYTTNYINEI